MGRLLLKGFSKEVIIRPLGLPDRPDSVCRLLPDKYSQKASVVLKIPLLKDFSMKMHNKPFHVLTEHVCRLLLDRVIVKASVLRNTLLVFTLLKEIWAYFLLKREP